MKKRLTLTIVDIATVFVCAMLSQWLVFGVARQFRWIETSIVAALFVLFLSASRFYKLRIEDSSLDLLKFGLFGMLPAIIIVCFFTGYTKGFVTVYERWVLTLCLSSSCGIFATRCVYRFNREQVFNSPSDKPQAIVYGAGDLGSTMARMAQKGAFQFKLLGFLDDNAGLKNEIVLGLPVFGSLDDIDSVLSRYDGKLSTLIIAITKISSEKIQKATISAKKHGLDVKIVPNLFETKGRTDVSLRDIDYADLLGRALITIDKEPLFDMFQGKTILVTGAGGSIGSEICRQIMTFGPKKLVALDIDETELHDLCLRLLDYQREWSDTVVPVVCDIKNAEKISRIFNEHKPNLVFHAAAYKHVPLMELYPEEAILTNVTGSFNVFKAASQSHVEKVVVISTDKAVNPTNIMGATKRTVEMTAAAFNRYSNTDFCCVRFGNVIGSRGSMLPLFLEEIKAGKPITVTDRNIIRYFMAIPEAVSLVFMAASLAKGGEVMVLDMGEPVKIYDFAKKLIDIFGDGRSEIRITGLRPGEKLYEELLADKDNTIPTVNEKIFKAKVSDKESWTLEYLEDVMEKLKKLDRDSLVAEIQDTVPEFHRAMNPKEK